MIYDVFISYSTKDKKVVEGICGYLERYGYRCFVAYRDINPGIPWPQAIPPAIRESFLMVVVFSEEFNSSEQTDRELTIAVKNGKTIIPFRISDVDMTGTKEWVLSNLNWIDAFPDPERYFGRLKEAVSKVIGQPSTPNGSVSAQTTVLPPKPTQQFKPIYKSAPEPKPTPIPQKCPNLKVMCNLDCVMYIDGEVYATLSAGRLQKIPLVEGDYMLIFESVENRNDRINTPLEMPNKDKLYNVDLLAKKDERERKEIERMHRELMNREERWEREARGKFNVEGVEFKMVYVEGGTFTMGATSEQGSDAYDDEKPAHKVTLSDYYIGETQVTQALWKAVMGDNPSDFKGSDSEKMRAEFVNRGGDPADFKGDDNRPVEEVSWEVITEKFIPALNRKTGCTFRLPTEAEWEYAARGGSESKRFKYSGSNNIDVVAWHNDNSGIETHIVKGKKANELGLYDMSGNVWEWCNDWYDIGYYIKSKDSNPQGPDKGSSRVIRGGSWSTSARGCRVSIRDGAIPSDYSHFLGFRLALVP